MGAPAQLLGGVIDGSRLDLRLVLQGRVALPRQFRGQSEVRFWASRLLWHGELFGLGCGGSRIGRRAFAFRGGFVGVRLCVGAPTGLVAARYLSDKAPCVCVCVSGIALWRAWAAQQGNIVAFGRGSLATRRSEQSQRCHAGGSRRYISNACETQPRFGRAVPQRESPGCGRMQTCSDTGSMRMPRRAPGGRSQYRVDSFHMRGPAERQWPNHCMGAPRLWDGAARPRGNHDWAGSGSRWVNVGSSVALVSSVTDLCLACECPA